ncbi:unnamed protein product, partial [Symbiodinium necroappetens]
MHCCAAFQGSCRHTWPELSFGFLLAHGGGWSPGALGELRGLPGFQKTLAAAAVGKASCVCKTKSEDDLDFQETQDGNCGCQDSFFWNEAESRCQACTDGQNCQWNNVFANSLHPPELQPGFWAEPAAEPFRGHSVYRCFNTITCPSTNSACAPGRHGKACSLCLPGHFGSHDEPCSSCGDTTFGDNRLFFAAFAIPGVLCVTLLAHILFQLTSGHSSCASLGASHFRQNFRCMQLISVVSFFGVYWPTILTSLWDAIRALTSDLVRIPSLGCMLPHTPFAEMICTYAIPIVLILSALAWPLLNWLLRETLSKVGPSSANINGKWAVKMLDVLKMVVWVSALFFNTLIQKGFLVFTCVRSPNGVQTVVVYPQVECPSGTSAPSSEWLELLPFAIVYCAVVGFGLVGAVTHGARQMTRCMVASKMQDRGPWDFLATEYRDAYVWWLAVVLLKDLSVNIGAAVFTSIGSWQLL